MESTEPTPDVAASSTVERTRGFFKLRYDPDTEQYLLVARIFDREGDGGTRAGPDAKATPGA